MISLQNLKDVLQGVTDKIMDKVDDKQDTIPTYTLAEYESIKDTIPEGTLFNIKDDKMATSLMCPNFLKTITIRTNLYASIQRSGNIVIISISGGPTQFVAHSKQWENLLEIPYGYRPIKDVFGNLYDPNNDLNWIMRTNNGYLQGFGQSILTNIWPFGCMAYVTVDEYPTDYD